MKNSPSTMSISSQKNKITGETEEDVYAAKFMAERDIRILKIFKEQYENSFKY